MNLQTFSFEYASIRVSIKDGEPVFVAKDVADFLGMYWDGARTIAHVPEEWRGRDLVPTPSGAQDMSTLTESGLYFFLARSDKPKAVPFQKWIAGEVLPSIRKTGAYSLENEAQRLARMSQAEVLQLARRPWRPRSRSSSPRRPSMMPSRRRPTPSRWPRSRSSSGRERSASSGGSGNRTT